MSLCYRCIVEQALGLTSLPRPAITCWKGTALCREHAAEADPSQHRVKVPAVAHSASRTGFRGPGSGNRQRAR